MKKLLLLATALTLFTLPAKADTISFLGINPTSGAGAFSNTDPGSVLLPAVSPQNGGSGLSSLGGVFTDIYDFTLTMDQTLTIAFATNTYAGGAAQFITNFTGAVLDSSNAVLLGPELAVGCNAVPLCQVFGGSAFLAAGDYHLRITGNAGVDSGYGGNISTFAAVPIPAVGSGLPMLIAGLGGLIALNKRRKARNYQAFVATA